MEITILITSQIVFSLCRTLNVRFVSKEKTTLALLTSMIIKLTWLISSAIGIKSIIEQDWLLVSLYIIAGLVGDYVAMKIKIK